MIKAIVFDVYGVLGLEAGRGVRVNDELVPVIKRLKSLYRLGVLSNTDRDFLDRFLNNNDLRPLFDVVLASSQTRFVKPQREIFDIMAERLDLPLEQILFIDDSPVNTAAARRYGMSVITYENVNQLNHL